MALTNSWAAGLALATVFLAAGCTNSYHEDLRRRCEEHEKTLRSQRPAHEERFAENGFDIVGTQRVSPFSATYTLRKIPDNGISYEGTIDLDNEIDSIKAIDRIYKLEP